MATSPSQAYRDGDTRTVNGIAYVRQGGVWTAQSKPGLDIVVPKAPAPQTPAQAQSDTLSGVQKEQAIKEFNATHNPDGTPKPVPKPPSQIPAAAASGIQANLESLRSVDAAIQALKTRPESIGTGTGALGDTFTQWNDPEGQDVRSRVGKIGAVTIHDLSGAAVSATEAPRFQPFVPTVSDRPEIAARKLQQFREALQAQIKESLDYYNPNNGYMPYKTPQADQFVQSFAEPLKVDHGQTEGGFGLQQDPRLSELNPEQGAAYDAWWKANKNPKPEQLVAFLGTLGVENVPLDNAKAIIQAANEGRGISHDRTYVPDISDVRGGDNSTGSDTLNATARGVLDTPTFGTIDKIVAGADTLFKGDTMEHNLQRQYAISDYDHQQHPVARFAGQVVGGGLLPLGEFRTIPQVVGKAAAAGGAYGTGSSRSLADVPGNALTGAIAAPAVALGFKGAGKAVGVASRKLFGGAVDVPPLVDPATGELNQPLDAAGAVARYQAMTDFGLKHVSPGMAGGRTARVIEQGLNNVPGSAGVMEDFNTAASKELRGAMQGVAGKFGSSKTLNEGGAELQRGANEWMSRADKVASKAYDLISIPPNAKAKLDNTVSALADLTSKVGSNPELAEEVNDPVLKRYLDAMQKGGLDWSGLKEFRTFIGAKGGEFRFSQDARKDGYQALYGALSQDMRDTAAALGSKELRQFERANSLFAAKENRIESGLVRILGPNAKGKPESAAAAVQAMTKGGKSTGDLRALAEVRSSTIKSGAWDEIASTLIHLGGQPANSEGRQFSPQTFVNWYADMAEPARKLLFKSATRTALDEFVAVNQQLARVKGMTNSSNTTPTMIGSGVVAASGMLAVTHPTALLVPLLGGSANFATAKLWTSAPFVRWATGYARAVASGKAGSVKSRISLLDRIAATNPQIREPIIKLQQSLLSGANDNARVVTGAAAGGSDPDRNQQ